MKTVQYITITAIILLAAAFNGHMDHLMFHDSQYNPAETWKNKYAKDAEGALIPLTKSPWYYLGLYKPAYKEAFPLSTTALVSLTDPWHRSKAISFALWRLAVVLSVAYTWRIAVVRWRNIAVYAVIYVGLWVVQAIGFHLTYSLFH